MIGVVVHMPPITIQHIPSSLDPPSPSLGERLIRPQQWCDHQWQYIISPFTSDGRPLWQLAKRISLVVALILLSLFAYPLGLLAKLCLIASPSSLSPSNLQNSKFSIPEAFIPDLWIHTASFLEARDFLKFYKLSRPVNKIFQLSRAKDVLWKLLWKSLLKAPSEPPYFDVGQESLKNPKEQLKAYSILLKEGAAGYFGDFFSWIAMHMPGGAIAFQTLPFCPVLTTWEGNINYLSVEDMTASVMRGEISSKNRAIQVVFLSMRIGDRTKEEGGVEVLTFACKALNTQPSFSSWREVYYQPANRYWSANELIEQAPQDNFLLEEYILAILRREDLTQREEFSKPPFKNHIELV